MAYSTTNPPVPYGASISGQRPTEWMLDGADAVADVQVTGYISNGGDLGMKVNDVVKYQDTNLGITSFLNVASVAASGAVDLQDATTIGSTTNTD